jgi:phosphate transport system substrate-binding protein
MKIRPIEPRACEASPGKPPARPETQPATGDCAARLKLLSDPTRLRVRRWLLVAALLLHGACAAGDDPPPGSLSGKLVVTGSSTVAPLAAEIARRFEELHPGTRVDVQTGGSSRGIADARSGVADLGMASRALTRDEGDLVAHTLARDGVCLVVHADNPVTDLDREQVAAIYTGAIEDWSEVGGATGPITVVNKASGRATLEVFLDHFGLAEDEIAADVVIGDNQQGLKTVAATPGAIGYVSIGAAEHAARHGSPIKLLPVGSVAPTAESVAAGRFPITRPLNLLSRAGEPLSPLQRAFLDFAQSREVHDLVTAQLFVPAAPDAAPRPASAATAAAGGP